MRLSGRPRHETLGLQRSNNGGPRTHSFAMNNYGAVRRQIEVHPARPVRHHEEMRIRDGILASHQVVVGRQMPIKMSEASPETRAKYVSRFVRHALIEERREATL